MKKTRYQILLNNTGLTFNLPVYLENTLDEMGVMTSFDGNIEQIEQLCNFSYTQTGSTVQVYNTVNKDGLKKISDATFTINWGDGRTSDLPVQSGNIFTTSIGTYTGIGEYSLSIVLNSPWTTQKLHKIVTIPQDLTVPNPLGTFSGFTIPYTSLIGSQDYLTDLDYTNVTGDTVFYFAAIGKSRISELKLYGTNDYSGVTTGITNNVVFSGYTIDNLDYTDYPDGITTITGSTSEYTKETVFDQMLTRNEHFIGFIDDPTIYSDVFIERGKQGVLEKTLRLGEIDNIGELDVYGNGFFNVRKQ